MSVRSGLALLLLACGGHVAPAPLDSLADSDAGAAPAVVAPEPVVSCPSAPAFSRHFDEQEPGPFEHDLGGACVIHVEVDLRGEPLTTVSLLHLDAGPRTYDLTFIFASGGNGTLTLGESLDRPSLPSSNSGSELLPFLPADRAVHAWIDIDLSSQTIGYGFSYGDDQGMRTGKPMLVPRTPFTQEPRFRHLALNPAGLHLDELVIR